MQKSLLTGKNEKEYVNFENFSQSDGFSILLKYIGFFLVSFLLYFT
jgi:hypothetical protein